MPPSSTPRDTSGTSGTPGTSGATTPPATPGAPRREGGASVDFDEFYLGARRRLLLQCLALTGDLAASRAAVREAFVAARHHWRKVSRLDDPENWVRPRAWSIAQRRRVGKLWRREKDLTEQQTAALDALAKLGDTQRKTLLLAHLAALPLLGIGRELGQTQETTERHLQQATSTMAVELDCDSVLIRSQLESLAPLVHSPGLPRVTAIHRSGRRRRRWHAVRGSAVVLALALLSGWFVSANSTEQGNRPAERPVTKAMLLEPVDLAAAQTIAAGTNAKNAGTKNADTKNAGTNGSDRGSDTKRGAGADPVSWTVTHTSDNTAGDGINTICQQSRFADDRGIATWVRTLESPGKPARHLVQTVEISASPGGSLHAYDTTLGWFAGCTEARVQLAHGYRVDGIGDDAQALRLRLPGPQPEHYIVVVARSGSLTTTVVQRTAGKRADPLPPLLGAVAATMRKLCTAGAIETCRVTEPRAVPALLPPSGETPGMLATADLPAVAQVEDPWMATDPVSGGTNLAATPCDRSDFGKAAERHSRTFLIPEADLPERFGITETYGRFPSRAAARTFATRVRDRMARCEKDQLGTEISHRRDRKKGIAGSSWSMWRQTAEINDDNATVSWWMGIAQVDGYVAQVTLTPSGRYDVDEHTFAALVVRARDRLLELPR